MQRKVVRGVVGRGGKGRERLGPAFEYEGPRSHGRVEVEKEEEVGGCVYPGESCTMLDEV